MNIEIRGKKYLNSNLYDNIVVGDKKNNEDTILITATSKEYKNVETIAMTGKSFIDSISHLSSQDKVLEIINYYLRNNNLQLIDGKEGIHIFSTSGRRLYIKSSLLDKQMKNIILKEIMKKYREDRLMFLEENTEVRSYEIYGTSGLEHLIYHDGTLGIGMLLYSNNSIGEQQLKMLKKFILEKLCSIGEKANIVYREKYNHQIFGECDEPCLKVVCRDLIFDLERLPKQDIMTTLSTVYAYNYSIDEQDKKQLKLGGIK